MWYLLYNVFLILASPVILLVLLAKKRCRRGLPQRLGLSRLSGLSGLSRAFGSPRPNRPAQRDRPDQPDRPVIWLHAVSLGEVTAAVPLVRALARRYPEHRLVVSTVTETGREAVEQRLAGIAEHCYAPLDFPWVVSAFVNRLNPRLYLFVETELWPNLLRTLRQRGVPTVLVNGRVSSRSFERQRRGVVRPLYRRMLESVSLCLMQSDRDAERIIALGADPARVHRTGNIKFDQPVPEVPANGSLCRDVLRLAEGEELFVAGSTHPGEEEQLIACYQTLLQRFPALVLLVAPRHIERAPQVETMIRGKGLEVVRRSRLGADPPIPANATGPRVILLDTRGELATVYRFAALAFVGGTLIPVGGHNLLEPAVWGKPVWFGPHTDHCQEVADLLIQAGGGRQVRDGEQLAAELAAHLDDRPSLARMGEAAQRAVLANRGALDRSLELIASVLDREKERARFEVRSSTDLEPRTSNCLLQALALPYGAVSAIRASLYREGWLPTRKLPCRVISVGNLTVGGTGKTPVVIFLTEWLLAQGRRVGVLSRGYRRRSRSSQVLVSDGRSLLAGPAEAGDEPYLIAKRCPTAIVAVGADRYALGRWVLEQHPIDCFVLDDGFQHLALHRDVNLLLIDATDAEGLRAVFPAGRLREPLTAAARATVLLLTRSDEGAGAEEVLQRINRAGGPAEQPIRVSFKPDKLVNVATGKMEEPARFAGTSAVAFSGIARPVSFHSLLERLGLKLAETAVFPDHHEYRPADLEDLRRRARQSGAEMLITTEKDAGKVAPLLRPDDRCWAVRLRTEIVEGQERLECLLLGVRGSGV